MTKNHASNKHPLPRSTESLPKQQQHKRIPRDQSNHVLMDGVRNHEPRKHVHGPCEECWCPTKCKRPREVEHCYSRENVMPNDHEFKPVEAQLTVFDEQRKRCARKVENGFLDVSEERHAVEREWIPERNLTHGHRHSSKIPRRVVMIQEILPEERISEQDITE